MSTLSASVLSGLSSLPSSLPNFQLCDRCILFDGVGCGGRVRHSDINLPVRGRGNRARYDRGITAAMVCYWVDDTGCVDGG